MKYEVIQSALSGNDIILRNNDDDTISSIPTDPTNSDYQAYLAYVANGNVVPDSTLPSNSSIPQAGE
jgi:hypothetical protein